MLKFRYYPNIIIRSEVRKTSERANLLMGYNSTFGWMHENFRNEKITQLVAITMNECDFDYQPWCTRSYFYVIILVIYLQQGASFSPGLRQPIKQIATIHRYIFLKVT